MFGLMRPAKSCGNPKTVQRMHYCGTCKTIGQQYGQKSRLLLNYDAVFLAELLTSIAGENPQVWASPLQAVNQCFKMPKKGEEMPLPLQYAAAANVFLAELKLDDSIRDRAKRKHKFVRWFMTGSFFKAKMQLEKWGLDTNFFWQQIETQSSLESAQKADFQTIEGCLQYYSQTTAQMTAALFAQAAHVLETPAVAPILYKIGFAFGEMVYALDAFEDLENDIFTQQFNPLSLFFGEENGSIGEEFLEKSRQFVLSKAEEIGLLFTALPIANEQIEQFQARLTSNVALRLYQERSIPRTFTQKIAARWQAAKNAANDLLCAPESKGKKFQYHFFSVIFFVLPALSVELSQQNRSQMFSGLAIFTAMLAAVGLTQSVIRKKQKRGLWQRLKNAFGRKKDPLGCNELCDCEDCCIAIETCGMILGIIIWIVHIVAVFIALIYFGFPWWMPVLWALIAGGLTTFLLIIQDFGSPNLPCDFFGKIYMFFLIIAILSPLLAFAFVSSLSIMSGIIAISVIMFSYAFLGITEWFTFRANRKQAKQERLQSERQIAAEAQRTANTKKRVEEFFAKNAQRPEVKILSDGKTQYEVLNEGDPNKPKQEHSVLRFGSANNPEMKGSRVVEKNINKYASSDKEFKNLADMLPNVGSKIRFYIPPPPKPRWYEEEGKFIEIEVLDELDPAILTTPSGLRYEILDKGDESKPKVENQIIEQNVYCDGEPCDKKFVAPVWFKEGSLEKEAYDLMKYQGAKYRFYRTGTKLPNASFDIEIKKSK